MMNGESNHLLCETNLSTITVSWVFCFLREEWLETFRYFKRMVLQEGIFSKGFSKIHCGLRLCTLCERYHKSVSDMLLAYNIAFIYRF